MSLNNKESLKRFLKFGLVGVIGSIVDFGVFNFLSKFSNIPALQASIISFALAVVNNFIWNRYWTFPETRYIPLTRQLFQFAIVSVAGLAIRTPLFALLVKVIIPLAEKLVPNLLTPTILGHNTSLAIVILVVMLWNFFINSIWTFRASPKTILDKNHES